MDFTRKSQKYQKKNTCKNQSVRWYFIKTPKKYLYHSILRAKHTILRKIFYFVSRAKRFGKIYAIREKNGNSGVFYFRLIALPQTSQVDDPVGRPLQQGFLKTNFLRAILGTRIHSICIWDRFL